MTNLETLELMELFHVTVLPMGKQWVAGIPEGAVSVSIADVMFLVKLPAWRVAPTVAEAVQLAVQAEAVRRRALGEL